MLALHSLWDADQLFIWAESSTQSLIDREALHSAPPPGSPLHPFSMPGRDLSRHLQRFCKPFPYTARSIILRLPSTKNGPLPSPWLLLDEPITGKASSMGSWTIEALAYSPSSAFNLLLSLPSRPPAGVAYAASLDFWSRLAAFTLELLARQKFMPDLKDGQALWKALMDERDKEHLKIFAQCLPPVCLAMDLLPQSSSQTLVESFVDRHLDSFLRQNVPLADIFPPRRGRPPKSVPLAKHFLQALCSETPSLKATPEELNVFTRGMHSWLSSLHTVADMPFRTCFRLDPPPSGQATWTIRFFLQARDDRSLLLPAADVWKTRSASLTWLRRRLKDPQERLLADLGRAARVFPRLEMSLETARPVGLEMSTEDAYSFLKQSAPLLEQEGFGVLLPAWWERPGQRLGVKLRLRSLPKESAGQKFFGLDTLVAYDWEVSLGSNHLSEAELAELIRLKVPLVQVRGEWVELRPEEIETAIEFFQKRNGNMEMTLKDALRLGLAAGSESAPEGLPVLSVQSDGWLEELQAIGAGRELEPNALPHGFCGSLRPYQARGVSWLVRLGQMGLGACLADDMGLGKTIELIAYLLAWRESGAGGPSLLVCPLSVTGNWQRELERFAPCLRTMIHHGQERLEGDRFAEAAKSQDVVITTYALAQADEESLSRVAWQHLILDEAQNIKNPSAKQTAAIKRLQAVHRIALTGTPVENRLSELWSIMDFLNSGYLGSARSFRHDFVLPIEKYRNRERTSTLRSLIQPFILRRLKTDRSVISDLPEKTEIKEDYHLTPEQASLYAATVEQLLLQIENSAGIKRKGLILSTLTRLKQICNHPALFLQDGSPLAGRSGKLMRLEEMLSELLAAGDKALIFTQFAGMGAMLRHHLQETFACEALFLHGGTPKKKRDAMVQEFQSGSAPLFILSLKAGGTGLNLTAANHVFHFDRWWNPAVENQATDRVFRIGQKRGVFVHKFVCPGTLEEHIDRMIEEKKGLAESVIGSGEAWLTELSNDALREVFALRREAVSGEAGGEGT